MAHRLIQLDPLPYSIGYSFSSSFFCYPDYKVKPPQGSSSRIQSMAPRTPPTRRTLEVPCDPTQSFFGHVLVSGSYVTSLNLMQSDDN